MEIQDWKVPRKAMEVRSFLGLAGYYRKFVKCFAKVTTPVLTLLDGSKPFTVYTCNCEAGLGALFDARGKGDMQKAVSMSIAYRPQTDERIERGE